MDGLPDHVLIKIFNLLQSEDLNKLMNVCERWSTLIKTSSVLMRNFQISITRSHRKSDKININIPFDEAKYESMCIRLPKWSKIKASKQEEILSILAEHEHKIKRLKVEFFKHPDFFGFEFKNVTHLEIVKDFESKWMPKFENLTHLVMEITQYEDVEFLKTAKFNLKHFSLTFNLEHDIGLLGFEIFYNFILRHIDSLEELKMIGLLYEEELKESIIKIISSEKLKFLHLEIGTLIQTPNYVSIINNGKRWTQIDIIDSVKECESAIKNLIRNFPHIKRVRFEQRIGDRFGLSILKKISNMQVATYNFDNPETRRDLNEATCLHEIVISHIDNEYEMSKIIEQLRMARNLKILRIKKLSARAGLDRMMSQLLRAVKDLEELHLEAYSKHFDVSEDAVGAIYDEAKSLKQLTIAVAREKLEAMKERLRVFKFTKVNAVAIEKKIHNTRLKEEQWYENDSDDIKMTVSFTR